MAPSSLSLKTATQPQPVSNGNGNSPLGRAAVPDSPSKRGNKNSNPSHSNADLTISTTLPPTSPTSATTVTNARKFPSKPTRKDSIISASELKEKSEDDSVKSPTTAKAPASSTSVATPFNVGVDPLSQHIFTRTNTAESLSKQSRLRNTTTANPENSAAAPETASRQSADLGGRQPADATDAARDKKKGNSLLSRLGIRKAKADADSIPDDESEFSNEPRMNGADARVFSSVVDAAGYVPHHKEPPRYIRVRATHKKQQDREFNRMFLAQELVGTQPKLDKNGDQADMKTPVVTMSGAGAGGRKRERTGGAIWTTEFSRDGKYLAAAGKDGVVRIWTVISTPEERRLEEQEEAAASGERLSAPVFRERPVREFSGHSNEIIDLSWSKNNFLLSTSMDKTVRLWHATRDDCLCQFKHKDVVTKVAFHPTDDRFFIAGSLDMTLRLWSIPDKQIVWSAQLPDLITAVAFTPDGKTAIAGLLNGLCMLYETEGLKFQSQIHAKSSRGKNSKGSKITGINTMAMPLNSGGNGTVPGDVKIMVSTNDSRIRVYNLRDGSLDTKIKGHENACTQISATFSDDAQYIISGSENKKAFIWKTGKSVVGDSNKDKHPCESFDAHGDIVTTAVFAPKSTRQLLSASGDPLYDLCNPPPVVLMSADEAAASVASQAAPSESGSQELPDKPPPTPGLPKNVEYSPAYLARTAHPGGNIIVTTDDQGIIKVFRQDCAHAKRRIDSWETASTISRRTAGLKSAGIGRTSSIGSAARSSTAHSRRGSLSTGPPTGKLSSDMIMSWRQNVEGGRPNSIAGSMPTPTRSERSISPAKVTRGSATNLAADARKLPYYATSLRSMPGKTNGHRDMPDSPTSSVASRSRPKTAYDTKKQPPAPLKLEPSENNKSKTKPPPTPLIEVNDTTETKPKEDPPMSPPVPSFSFRPADDETDDGVMRVDAAGGSYGFWNLNRWKGLASLSKSSGGGGGAASEAKKQSHQRTGSEALSSSGSHDDANSRRKSLGSAVMAGDERPSSHLREQSHLSSTMTATDTEDEAFLRTNSGVSKLSSELTSESDGTAAAGEDGLKCRKCGAGKSRAKMGSGGKGLVCGRCGTSYA
ncbi:hypothetical protein N0V82_009343 [Gnomoniopsis sp. IMI 355080]|nr:hypothetical protein N0V82_009343 [Gnomoniopsis sp. IMI 355080]